MLVAFSRFFFAGSGGCAALLAGWQETPPWGLAAWFSMAFGAPSADFLPLFALRRSFSGFFCGSGASREAPWSRFLPAREENAAARPPSGVFCRGIAARSGRFGVIAFVRPSANRRFGGACRCFGAADRRPSEREMPPLRVRLVVP